MADRMQLHEGGCLCGAVRFRAQGALRPVIYCHCSQCRKQTGLYVAATAVAQSRFDLHPAGDLRWYAASAYARRGFCGICGTLLFWKPNEGDHIAILAGALDHPEVLTAGIHICVAGRPQFYAIADGLPQYDHDAPDVPIAGPG